MANITVNKNTVPGDKSALIPSGLRLGAPALTTRGLVERDFEQVVEFLDRGVKVTADIKSKVSGACACGVMEDGTEPQPPIPL